MKKMISVLVLVVALATMLTACGKFDCGLCGEKKSGKKYQREILGQKVEICKDCNKGLEELSDALK